MKKLIAFIAFILFTVYACYGQSFDKKHYRTAKRLNAKQHGVNILLATPRQHAKYYRKRRQANRNITCLNN